MNAKVKQSMSSSVSLRVLVCDAHKSSRQHLCRFLSEKRLADEVIPASSTAKLMERLRAKQINLLFIDPLGLNLTEASDMIFQIREKYPQVIICLFVRPDAVRGRAKEFYAGERERFSHYFRLNKQLTGHSFNEAALLAVAECTEAIQRWRRHPGRIELNILSKVMEARSTSPGSVPVETPLAVQELSPVAGTRPLPVELLISAMPSFKSVARLFSRT